MKLALILVTMLMFHRLDGHSIWIAAEQITSVQGAGQIGFNPGTLIETGGGHHTVKENVNQVIRKIRGVADPTTLDNPADPK